MIKTFIFLSLFLSLYTRNDFNEQIQGKEKTISIFRPSGFYEEYKISIDKKYFYADKHRMISNQAFGELITKYKTKSNNVDIYLRINGKDTSFRYNISIYDSLMMGRG